MDREPKIETKLPVLERQEVRDFVEDRSIKPEDLYLIQELASFPKDMIIEELHNLFNTLHERSEGELERLAETATDENKRKLYQSALNFYRQYDWAISYNLVRVLERI